MENHPTDQTACILSQWCFEDLPKVAHLAQVSVGDLAWPLSHYESAFQAGDYGLLLKSQDDDLLGVLIGKQGLDVFDLMDIHVKPEARGQGLAQQLIGFCMDHAKDQKLNSIMLEVRTSNQAAIQLYKKCVFQEIHRRKNYYAAQAGQPAEDALIFQVIL